MIEPPAAELQMLSLVMIPCSRSRATSDDLAIIEVIDGAEQQLLELVRRDDAKEFTVTISCKNGHWIVAVEGKASGEGESFAEAWHEVDPLWGYP